MRRADSMRKSISVERDPSGVATIIINVPDETLNVLSDETGREFTDVISELAADTSVKAVVIASGKPDSFMAGAKIDMLQSVKTEQDGERLAREAQAHFNRLEELRFPVVAAIHGVCLGGGLEMVLACQWRIASDHPKTSLGLPEVMIGLIPGAGGTQRLPRVVGLQRALELILTGKQVRAIKALKMGLVDEVVPAPILREVAKKRALELAEGKTPPRRAVGLKRLQSRGAGAVFQELLKPDLWTETALEENPLGRAMVFRKAREKLGQKAAHYPAPAKALESIRVGLEEGLERGLAFEARTFGELVVTPVARRLAELFFAQTALKKSTGVEDPNVKPREVRKVGVLGGGLMGSGIAFVSAAQAGLEVRLKDRDPPSVGRGLGAVRKLFDEKVHRRSMTALERDAQMARVTGTTELTGFESCGLVIEAVFEDISLKRQVLKEIEEVCGPQTVFASNTSSIPIARIAEMSARPQNVVGMHYFSPVQKMPLLEVIAADKSSPEAIATAVAVGKRQGKTVIVVGDGPGFYTSRVLAPYMNEAARLLVEGADPLEIDRALVEFGFPVGPITLLDEVGIDVAAKAAHVLADAFGERMMGPAALEKLMNDGRLGRKARKGFFKYDPDTGKKLAEIDEAVWSLLPEREKRTFDRREIAERVVLPMVNEAMRCLGEKIVRSPRDGDIGAVFGLGFPPFLGGPFRYVDVQGAQSVVRRLESLASRHGARFEPAPLLADLARSGKKLYS